ncbi:hypothetical protein BDZ94DRAFT_516002 [Collybia nuda]|uniref:C3H1-type domain-containing protein n=1 Tax=Collybia nuda TaxID=64659 RepID=A0A9P5Y8H7_9AGAR|nr:hypothetical protein BDZ94DRAFT_516002 [Collybia nuda]
MEQPSKKPPHKKRHTKPCRFFQTSRCPLSAEECDFAHVQSNHAIQSPSPCRYYAAGRCVNGPYCRYRHVIENPEASGDTGDLKSPITPQEMYHAPWAIYQDPFPSSAYIPAELIASHKFHPDLISPTHSIDSSMSLSTSASSSLSDDVLFMTGDPQYSEHPHSYQSQVHVTDDVPLIHVPPFYPSLNTHVPHVAPDTNYPAPQNIYGSYAFQPPISLVSPTHTRKHPPKQKIIQYKTKPCRFYGVNGVCPNGEECTFIHDEPGRQPEPSTIVNPQLPPKPVSKIEENKKKNFFPISWRVIGGGVKMGGLKQTSSTLKTSESPDIAVESDRLQTSDADRASSPGETALQTSSKTKPTTRPRSTSIPSTPSIAHVNVESLFSAESPGGL